MADEDRPIVLVPLATARKAARRAGVTLNLSAEDIALAGKWKHGWIPLDAVASAVKAKRYRGGGGEGRTVRGKGRAGSAVEARREPSRGRPKTAPTLEQSRKAPAAPAAPADPRVSHPVGARVRDEEGNVGTITGHTHLGLVRWRAEKQVDSRGKVTHRGSGPYEDINRAKHLQVVGSPPAGPRRESHISAEPLKDGRHKLTDAKSGESVKAVHLASFHSQGHTITGVRGGQMHTRDDSGKAHVYDPATGRAATSGLEGKSADDRR